ncbi:MAG: SDR family oxidoreductase [Armatimonadota bacterium]|nr:SDR family oxidoreductase [Armatimonadota bacterium]
MRVFVTGLQGYIGTVLGATLRSRGHVVAGADTGFYRERLLYDDGAGVAPYLACDVRELEPQDLVGYDAVVHLAELSNDPVGYLNPAVTYEINYRGSVRLARLCKQAGVPRFVYSSSCSVYGRGSEDYRVEESALDPRTPYAVCKVLVEQELLRMADDEFSPTVLRNATAYGASPAMRFDLVLNNLAGWAWTTGEIRMTSNGSPWRPVVHVRDIAEAVACVLDAPRAVVHRQIFNVGQTQENYRVAEIAEIVAQVFPGCRVSLGQTDSDERSYRVSFEKIHAVLPGFRCQHDVRAGAHELRALFERVQLTRAVFEMPTFTRVKCLQRLITGGQVDEALFWRHRRRALEESGCGLETPVGNARSVAYRPGPGLVS